MKRKVPKYIVKAFCHIIKTECRRKSNYVKRSYDAEIREEIRQLQMIGVPLMLGGFLTKGSMEPLKLLASLTLRDTQTLARTGMGHC